MAHLNKDHADLDVATLNASTHFESSKLIKCRECSSFLKDRGAGLKSHAKSCSKKSSCDEDDLYASLLEQGKHASLVEGEVVDSRSGGGDSDSGISEVESASQSLNPSSRIPRSCSLSTSRRRTQQSQSRRASKRASSRNRDAVLDDIVSESSNTRAPISSSSNSRGRSRIPSSRISGRYQSSRNSVDNEVSGSDFVEISDSIMRMPGDRRDK